MMTIVFAALLLALLLGWFAPRGVAVAALMTCLLLAIGQFLWEVYSPEYGFRMPWLQTHLDLIAPAAAFVKA